VKHNVEKDHKRTHKFFRKYSYTSVLRITNMANWQISYKVIKIKISSNITVNWITFMSLILEVPVSSICTETCYLSAEFW
jgi:hypothetical protein